MELLFRPQDLGNVYMGSKLIIKSSKKVGLPPGSIIHVGDQKIDDIKITVYDYDKEYLQIKEIKNIEELFLYIDTPTVTWIDINGIHDTELINEIGTHFQIHPLVLEDILHNNQRPKIEDFDKYLYIVLRMFYVDENDSELQVVSEQVSLILGQNFVISFQEASGDTFDPIRMRIQKSKGRIREMGSDYLMYVLVDSIVDNYFVVLEKMGERIETLEEGLLDNPNHEHLEELYLLKNEVIYFRKSVWPMREVTNNLLRDDYSFISKVTRIYIKDAYDHIIQIIDSIETYRDLLAGLMDIYLSSISNKMNEIMKMLTVISTIFIPLTFLAGVYGMNFQYMPELHWKWGYPILWIIMAFIAFSMYVYFKKKKWV